MAISFGNNDYGITRKEWRAFKKELKAADKKNDNYELTKADYKEIKAHIKTGDLGAYMDKIGEDMKSAIGLSLSGKVDDMDEAQRIAKGVDLKDADLDKVLKYINNRNVTSIGESLAKEALPVMNETYDVAQAARTNPNQKDLETRVGFLMERYEAEAPQIA